ncbi:MAG: ATP-binding cassette domain-containing protein, partial [Actinomycetota bacterium]|nr:ATP-binding cassette domain-containing protein [Actinomycetota bacterium]
GEAVALVGPNGAGKTTTLSAITGLVPIADGSIRFDDSELSGTVPEDVVRRGVALVPEGRHIFGSLTVAENLKLGITARPDRDQAKADMESILERFPVLGRLRDGQASQLSGGEQQQLAIGRALLAAPKLLLLDEPSLGLAPLVVDLVFEVLEEQRKEGVAVLLVEQHVARATGYADRSYILSNGEIQELDPASVNAGVDELAGAYLGGGN